MGSSQQFGWVSIVRCGLVQTSLGGIVVLTTSALNRVMVVELALAAMLPGILVGLHSALQISRPLWGHLSDSRRRTPWIVGGMAILAVSGTMAAQATALMAEDLTMGIGLAVVAYLLIGVGVGAAGTSLLALLAANVSPERKAPAAAIVWIMMIFGFIVTTAVAGTLLEPFTFERLVEVTTGVCIVAFLVSLVSIIGVEGGKPKTTRPKAGSTETTPSPGFVAALREVLGDRDAFEFTIFVFVSMLAYNTQDLILEPFAGAVFGLTPGESTKLTSVQHSGVLLGMILVAFLAGRKSVRESVAFQLLSQLGIFSTKAWTVAGCLFSGLALFCLAGAGFVADDPEVLRAIVAVLGFANGAFAVAAIGWMMGLASAGKKGREGIRMGLWGGAQAIGFALGGFAGTLGVDLVRYTFESPVLPYAMVFVVEGWLFLAAALLASRLREASSGRGAAALVAASFAVEDVASSSSA